VKVPTAQFATAPALTARVDTAGTFERVSGLTGVEQLDLLDGQRALTIARLPDGTKSLQTVALP
jgi:hypothetical protein